jgi:restriction endonuclease Mrr
MRRRFTRKRKAEGCALFLMIVIVLVILSAIVSLWNYLVETKLIWLVSAIIMGIFAFKIWSSVKSEVERQKIEKQQVLEAQQQRQRLEDLDRLSPDEFNKRIIEILQRAGCQVITESGMGDKRMLRLMMPEGTEAIVIVKRTVQSIGLPEVKDLYGLVTTENVKEGFFFTNGDFTRQAREWAAKKPILLYDQRHLDELAQQASLDWKPRA